VEFIGDEGEFIERLYLRGGELDCGVVRLADSGVRGDAQSQGDFVKRALYSVVIFCKGLDRLRKGLKRGAAQVTRALHARLYDVHDVIDKLAEGREGREFIHLCCPKSRALLQTASKLKCDDLKKVPGFHRGSNFEGEHHMADTKPT
jgi:hypothetical protein